MDFLSQYENLQIVAEGETKTFRARQVAAQRTVLLHQLSSNPRSGRQLHLLALLLRYSSNLRPGSPSPILGIEEQGDSVWVITEDRPEMASLWDWMEREAPGKGASKSSSDPSGVIPSNLARPNPPVTPSSGLDEKTVIFATRLAAADSSPVVDLDATMLTASVPPSQEKAPPVPKAVGGGGDVTHAFPAVSEPGLQNALVTQSSTPIGNKSPSGGDSTLILHKPEDSPTASHDDRTRVIPSPASSASSFKTSPSGPSSGEEASFAPQQPAPLPSDSPEAPGEFTMIFRKSSSSSAEGEQKPRFMGFTAPTQDKARFIESTTQIEAPRASSDRNPPAPPSPESILQPSGSFVFRSPEMSEPANTKFFELPDFPSAPAEDPTPSAQPGEFTQVFQRPPASSTLEPPEKQEPGAFTRIFQIPVGSDLLAAAESQTIFSRPAAPAAPPAWQEVAEKPAAMPSVEAPLNPSPAPVAGLPKIPAMPFKPPAIPAIPSGGGLKPPAIPPIPKAPVPAGGGKAPGLGIPKVPAAPKLPNVPGAAAAEKAAGATSPSALPLILIFGGIVLVAVLTVLFFVTRH